MKGSIRLLVWLVAAVALGCGKASTQTPISSEDGSQLAEADQVQTDVRTMVNAAYQGDYETVLRHTHSIGIDLMGGMSQARSELETASVKYQSLDLRRESFEFPDPPTFLESDEHVFAIVPTKTVVSMKGQRAESLNYQFGIRKKGETTWKYLEGSRINRQNVRSLFPDFPSEYEFPKFYRKRL